MSERESPLLRWARLKQAAKGAEEIDAASAGSEAMPVPEGPFDPASLPPIESIAADSDIIGFLRAGVPAELMQAALRRAWTSDPAIRDFIGIAENQWDFNDPNAIPGFGPLAPTESGVDILAQISSRLEWRPPTQEGLVAPTSMIASNGNAGAADGQLVSPNPPLDSSGSAPNDTPAPAEGENTSTTSEARRTRRHGSALPR